MTHAHQGGDELPPPTPHMPQLEPAQGRVWVPVAVTLATVLVAFLLLLYR